MISKMYYKMPEIYKENFAKEEDKVNDKNILYLGLICLLIKLSVFVISFINPFTDLKEIIYSYRLFYLLSIASDFIMLSILFYSKQNNIYSYSTRKRLLFVYSFLIHLWAMGVAIFDQFQGEDIVVYFLSMFVISIVIEYSILKLTFVMLPVQLLFTYIVLYSSVFSGGGGSIVSTSWNYLIGALIIRYYIIELRKKNFVQKQKLQELNEELTYLSYIDPLSNLYNRRSWEKNYHHMYQKALEKQEPLDILIIDIDYFKQYNDTYGHVKGDEVIRSVSKILIDTTVGYTRNVGRYGGDEFAISFCGNKDDDTKKIIKNIKAEINNLNIENIGSKTSNILSLSIGNYRKIPADIDKPWEFVIEADKYLYKEKENRKEKGNL